MSIDLGVSNMPLPVAYASRLGDIWPWVHCTLGYFPLLSSQVADEVRRHGCRLIQKFFHDGTLPTHGFKPHKIHDTGSIAGNCSYKSRYTAKGGRNGFDLMINGKVEVAENLHELTAIFDHIHIDPGSRFKAVGSLKENCDVHRLAVHLQDYLASPHILTFRGIPDVSTSSAKLSHITLSKNA